MQADVGDIAIELGENLIQKILSNESLASISAALDAGAPVWYQNQTEGTSPLHAAAYMQNFDLAKLLIEKGAIWNTGSLIPLFSPSATAKSRLVDYLKITAGDIALSFNNEAIYNLIRGAGIRSGASET